MNPKTAFVAIPTQDVERSRAFSVDTLGFRPDAHRRREVWAGDTCYCIWDPQADAGIPFAPQKSAHIALHVDDIGAARAELEAKGVEFRAETFDTGICFLALFCDPDGNDLMLHHRHAPYD